MKTLLILGVLSLPLRSLHITSFFGYRIHPTTGKYNFHQGADLRAVQDTAYAILDGTVERVGYEPAMGLYIQVRHGSVTSTYGHLSQVLAAPAQTVIAGQPIAITGGTGRATAPHLHFAIAFHRHYIDPIKFLIQMLNQKNHEQKFQTPIHDRRRTTGNAIKSRDIPAARSLEK